MTVYISLNVKNLKSYPHRNMFTEIRALSKWLKSSALTHPVKMRGVMNNERDVFITFFSDSSVEAVKGNLLGIKCSSSWFLLMEINSRWLDIYVKTTAWFFYLYSRKLHSGQSKFLRHFFSSVHPFVFICVYTHVVCYLKLIEKSGLLFTVVVCGSILTYWFLRYQ